VRAPPRLAGDLCSAVASLPWSINKLIDTHKSPSVSRTPSLAIDNDQGYVGGNLLRRFPPGPPLPHPGEVSTRRPSARWGMSERLDVLAVKLKGLRKGGSGGETIRGGSRKNFSRFRYKTRVISSTFLDILLLKNSRETQTILSTILRGYRTVDQSVGRNSVYLRFS
jgi:hypothetical protein